MKIMFVLLLISFLLFQTSYANEIPEKVVDTETEIINKLITCESSGDPLAYNPMDNDGLPKFGILQFRYETFKEQSIKYGLLRKDAKFWEEIWKKDLQIELARLMLRDGKGKRWGCFYKINNK